MAVRIQEAVSDQGVNMRVEVEVLAEAVEGEEEGGATFGKLECGAQQLGDGLLGDGAEAF